MKPVEHTAKQNRGLWQLFKDAVSQPFIWILIIPLAFADICIEIYHRICFPLYNLPYVKRSRYIRIDRHRLKYLHFLRKIGCMYCGYANGLLHYASVITARTERYWCNIMHSKVDKDDDFIPPAHHREGEFIPYDDVDAYKKQMKG